MKQKHILIGLLVGLGLSANTTQAQTLIGADVGSPAQAGSVTLDAATKVYTVVGGGADIWGTADAFYYAYFKVTGDFDYAVNVSSHIGNSGDGGWSKAELMARQDDGSGEPQAGDPFIANMATRPSGDTANSAPAGVNNRGPQWRCERDNQCSWTTPNPTFPPNMGNNWLRLERVGSVFYMYTSDDGKAWSMYNPYAPQGWDTAGSWPPGTDNPTVAFFTNAWQKTVLLGLAVTAHSSDISTVTFANFGPYTGGTPVAITTQPPATLAVSQNNALELKVVATGDPVHYQWLKNGTAIARGVGATYKVDLAQMSDSGTYTVRVFGGGKEVVSSATVVSVTIDTQAPTVKKVTPDASFTTVRVEFSEPVTDTALTVGNYKLDQGVTVSSVTRISAAVVALTTSKMGEGVTYNLTVNAVKDTASPANTIVADTKVAFTSQKFATGFATYQRWQYTADPGAIDILATGILDGTLGAPTVESAVTSFQAPWGAADYYFARVYGFFIPPTAGNYVFFTDSDDQSNLYLSTDDTAANKKLIAQETAWSNQYQFVTTGGGSDLTAKRSDQFGNTEWPTANTITLKAGTKYYMEALLKEGSGGDGVTVTFIKEGQADPADSVAGMFMLGTVIGSYVDVNGAKVNITTQPKDIQGYENATVTFTVAADIFSPVTTNAGYQWLKNGQAIAGANAISYTTPLLTVADNGTKFSVQVSVPGVSATSSEATLTVVSDKVAPTVVAAGSLKAAKSVGVTFSELVSQATAETAANYKVNGAAVSKAVLHFGKFVELQTASTIAANFTLAVQGVKDLAGNTMEAATINGTLGDMTAMDVGDPGVDPLQPGSSVAVGNDAYFVAGGGHDVWDNADGFQFVYKEFTGPFDARVRVEAMNPNGPNTTTTWAKTELMVRESTAAGSRHNSVCATRTQGENAIEAQWRDVTDLGCGNLRILTPVPYPNAWLRLVREDATSGVIKLYTSTDGVTWTLGNTHTTPATAPDAAFPAKVLIGLAVTSHDNTGNDILAEGLFQNFSVNPFSAVVNPQLKVYNQAGKLSITWAGGTLVSSPTVKGTYAPVAGATSPFTVTPEAGKAVFYQIKQ